MYEIHEMHYCKYINENKIKNKEKRLSNSVILKLTNAVSIYLLKKCINI